MKKIEVFGSGCKRCASTEDLIKIKAKELGIEIDLHYIKDPIEIASRGIITTPAVIIDGKLVHKGGIPSNEEIEKWLRVAI